jgi:hypothetical protein
MGNKKKVCEPASSELYKNSDAKSLGADAKIIIALLKQQPLKRIELCEKASINESTFSRYKRLLLNKGVLKESEQGFSLWYYKESWSLWDILLERLQEANGRLTKLTLETPIRREKNPVTGRYEDIYESVNIEGVIILKGATKLEDTLYRSSRYDCNAFSLTGVPCAFLVTQFPIKEGDRFMWKNKTYDVYDVEQFFDGETLSYTVSKLTTYFSSVNENK